jgi:hypothetical protein
VRVFFWECLSGSFISSFFFFFFFFFFFVLLRAASSKVFALRSSSAFLRVLRGKSVEPLPTW